MKTQLAQPTAAAPTLTEPGQSAFSIALNLAHAIYADKRGARISRNEAVNLIQEAVESDRANSNAALRAALESCITQLDRETLGGEALDQARAAIARAK